MNNWELSYDEFIAKHRNRILDKLKDEYRAFEGDVNNNLHLNQKAFGFLFVIGGLGETFLISNKSVICSIVFAVAWIGAMFALALLNLNSITAYYLFEKYQRPVVVKEYIDRLARNDLRELSDRCCGNCDSERIKIEMFYSDCVTQILRYENFKYSK